ncbi:hypothetical protein ACN08Z_01135 [Rothia sp. P7181]|uniref:hypothetical protein n=1 Tax=unclassified Rothia (in: high G+C Gram-positive bacteria) TaxID=2689056 RepID=UPI003AC1D447
MSLFEIAQRVVPVILTGLVFGAGIPAFYAIGLRMLAGTTEYTADGRLIEVEPPSSFRKLIAYSIFAVIVLVIIMGILWIAKDFIYHSTGFNLFGVAG